MIAAGAITEGPDGDRFHADVAEVVHTHLNEAATMLVVEWWTPTHGLRRIERGSHRRLAGHIRPQSHDTFLYPR